MTNTILMIKPASFCMNEETRVNNYFQKEIKKTLPSAIQTKAIKEFTVLVAKLKKAGIDLIEINDTKKPIITNSSTSRFKPGISIGAKAGYNYFFDSDEDLDFNQATSVLMRNFYKRLKNNSKTKATQLAKLDYLADKNISSIKKSPYYWSSFVFIGDVEIENNYNFIIIIFSIILMVFLYLVFKKLDLKQKNKYNKTNASSSFIKTLLDLQS